ncbi:MAG: phage tail protein I [Desulfovibrio sp.]|nr:phage tail protein I [Desulfovibrio sp.]
MAKRLGNTPFADLLPSSLADDAGMRACAEALDGVLNKATRAIPGLLIYSRLARDAGEEGAALPPLAPLQRLAELDGGLESLPEAVLDLLAWQFHVEGYAEAPSLPAKRAMIYASLLLHRRRGTPWAVRHGLETTLQVPAEVREWYEYGGAPYFFRVRLDVAGVSFDARAHADALKVIMDHKNVRSWLDRIETFSRRELPIRTGLGAVSRTRSRAVWLQTLKSPALTVARGAGLVTRTVTRIPRIIHPANQPRLAAFAGLAAQTFTRSALCPPRP